MKRSRSIASAVILSATIVGSLLLAAPANAADVTFSDPALQACANQWIGQAPTAPVSTTQAASLTQLNCSSMGITNLGGIESFSSLDNLTLANNSIVDLTPVSALPILTALNVGGNQITDLTPLSGMTTLSNLGAYGNQISDISPLSTLTNLTMLYLYDNDIVDLGPVASLSQLRNIAVMDNEIVDLSPLSGLVTLVGVEASGNNITDLSPLSGLPKLESITADNNEISDLTGLTNLPVLNGISVEGNHLTDLSPLGLIADQFQNLFQVYARFQTITLPDVVIGQSTANPLLDAHGVLVTGVTGDANFVLAADGASWTYTAPATNELYILASYPGPVKPAWQLTGTITQNSIPAPVATTIVDDTATTAAGHDVTIDVLANDGLPTEPALVASTLALLDADGSPTTQVTVAGGTFEVVDGEIVFTPADGFTGAVADVDYQVTNADGITGQATIHVTVTATVVPPTTPGTDPGAPGSGASSGTTGTGAGTTSGVLASTGTTVWPIVAFALALFAAAGAILLRRRA